MFVLKIVGVVLTIAASAGIGQYFSTALKKRRQDLKDLKKSLLLLRGDIRFSNTPLPEAMKNLSIKTENRLTPFFQTISERLSSFDGSTFGQIWKETMEKELASASLKKRDKESLLQFGESLGYLDKEMQLGMIDQYIDQLEQEMEESGKADKEKTKLYETLGIMSGIFLCVLIF